MKRFLLLVSLVVHYAGSFAMDYYSQAGQTDPNDLASWNTLPAGGGANPASFTATGDRFIIQGGHSMTTTAIWTFGSATSFLQIQNGATLQGDHIIQFTGTLQIDNGGTYIHNNNGSVAQTPAGTSIFSGTEMFAANSNVEIRDWQSALNGLPNTAPGIIWGNLIINLQVDLGGAWNWNILDGTTLTINGHLDIRSTYTGVTPRELRLTGDGSQIINVGGNFLLSGTSRVSLKNNATANATGNVTMQVEGNVSLTGTTQLNLGSPVAGATVGVFDLRFKGNFSAVTGTGISSSSSIPYLVANGIAPQTFTCPIYLDCNFKIAAGATVTQGVSMANGGGKVFAILGTFNDNGYTNTLSGPLEVAGGIFNAGGTLTMGANRCRSCTGNGAYTGGGLAWCTTTGTKGRINFSGNSTTFNQNAASLLLVGSAASASPGDIYLAGNARIRFIDAGTEKGAVMLSAGSVLSVDGSSFIEGNADYISSGGTLRIGSADGITATLNTTNGNIRVSGTKTYDNTGMNSNFEYFGATLQVTGNGLPATITGTLKINNTAGQGSDGVTLSQATTVTDTLDLTLGNLTTTATELMTLTDGARAVNASVNSFVNGPLKKTGDEDFVFPVGVGGIYAPIGITNVSGESDTDEFTAQYRRENPQSTFPYNGTTGTNLDHISYVEFWTLDENLSSAAVKNVSLDVHLTSFCKVLDSTFVARWDGFAWSRLPTVITSGPVTAGLYQTGTVSTTGGVFDVIYPLNAFTLATSLDEPLNPLPVNLIAFNATRLTTSNALVNWELSAYCSPAARFEVQRAGQEKDFKTITSVSGSASSRFYDYTDRDLQNGINYYRLKMINEDESVSYSKVAAVLNGVNGLMLTSLYPSLIAHSATMEVVSSAAQKMDVLIVDMQGRIVKRKNYGVNKGHSTIQLSCGDLPPGNYLLTGITTDGKTNTLRFTRQ